MITWGKGSLYYCIPNSQPSRNHQQVIESEPSEGEVRYILNQSARIHIGWQTALGKSFQVFGKKSIAPVTGVVEDFNYRSLHHNIEPVVIAVYDRIAPGQLMVKISNTDYQSVLKELESIFTSIVSNTPFEYHFLDEQFQRLYEAENRTGKIIGFLTVIAIILALLGLYGLVSFAVQERTKEMAIRKVLGVSLPNVLQLLTKGYIGLLVIANILAVPMVWFILNSWLNNFSYRINLEASLFVVGSALVWLFVMITVSINVYQVSKIDPVEGLRYE
ncbi:MAG: FtsX-like permease family protein [Bacteroidetes bacterium]|nr:MAG: FtsX-like permease family protein [Bacteroidota bacterium]